ncbi:hypothetical protein LSH36_651g00009 [Paralvinella palmiformis]|uniref:Uncharacterized protein n=1 Tax=Paralvinella palmiformis TaxID=53620 RepID=A0AAD9MVP2_9ANNE|nr:hypothetical protein LSH36_651g00009 [Paralvinella palmiformis]
MIDECRISGEY